LVPIAFWLMGAGSTITIDLNPYLKFELIRESLAFMRENEGSIRQLFGTLIREDRFADLLKLGSKQSLSSAEFLDFCRIQYIAPGDAARTNLEPESVDFHTSFTVFEHIPGAVIEKILVEGGRIVRENGLFIHLIDYADHFAYCDPAISMINFLQYPDDTWQKYAGNRYMYMNRLRHDDYLALFESAGHRVIATEPAKDPRSTRILADGSIPLDSRFASKSKEVLATVGSWIASQRRPRKG
jgi:SAM-dependent methyltransferase